MNAPSLLPTLTDHDSFGDAEALETMTPLVLLQESDAQYRLRFHNNAINPARLKAKILENVLTVSGEFGKLSPKPFRRSFSLPHPVSNEQPRIQESNGYVTVHVNKHGAHADPH